MNLTCSNCEKEYQAECSRRLGNGVWRCERCDLVLYARIIDSTGRVVADESRQVCPNGCGAMRLDRLVEELKP